MDGPEPTALPRESEEWLSFLDAFEEVIEAKHCSRPKAKKWMRDMVRNRETRAIVNAEYHKKHHVYLKRLSDLSNNPERTEIDLFSPIDLKEDFDLHPDIMEREIVVYGSLWHAASLRAALGREVPGTAAPPRKSKTRESRGPKIKDFWPQVLGYAAGWLAEKGEAPGRQCELEKEISKRIAALGKEADPSTVRLYARQMLAGYRAQLDGE